MHNHSVYGISAPEKGWVPAPRYVLRRYRTLKLLGSFSSGRLLEIGCGAGALLHDLSAMGFLVDALESSLIALDIAHYINKGDPRVTIYQDIQDSWNERFEYILAFEVLEHIQDDLCALRQWHSWLKPEGHLLVSVPAHPERWDATDEWAGHFRRYRRIGLESVLQQAGFNIVHTECYGFPLANIIDPIRSCYHAKKLSGDAYAGEKSRHRAVCSSRSGVDRSLEVKLYPFQRSWVGTQVLRFFCAFQTIFCNSNLGNGFLTLGRRA